MDTCLNDNTITLIALLMLGGGIFIGVIARKLHQAGSSLLSDERRQQIAIGAVLLIIAALMVDPRVDPYIAPLDRALITTPPEQITPIKITVDLNDACPPAAPGLTDQLLMTIEARSDTAPLITGCNRIAERQYLTTGPQ